MWQIGGKNPYLNLHGSYIYNKLPTALQPEEICNFWQTVICLFMQIMSICFLVLILTEQ